MIESKGKNENKVAYLQIIQEPICRLSTISAIFKGFAATIVASVSAISYENISMVVLGLSFLPVLAFAIMDIYYLKLERQFRFLYNEVINDRHPINYTLKIHFTKEMSKAAKATVGDCIKSPSIYLFYPLLIVILLIVFLLKCMGKI